LVTLPSVVLVLRPGEGGVPPVAGDRSLVPSEQEVGDHLALALDGDRSPPLEPVPIAEALEGAGGHLDAARDPSDSMRLAVLTVSPHRS
jgi:hypothetical protein